MITINRGQHILGANRLQIDRLGGRIFKVRSGERSCMKDKISKLDGYISTLIDCHVYLIIMNSSFTIAKSCCWMLSAKQGIYIYMHSLNRKTHRPAPIFTAPPFLQQRLPSFPGSPTNLIASTSFSVTAR